jgi:hypothetical protein
LTRGEVESRKRGGNLRSWNYEIMKTKKYLAQALEKPVITDHFPGFS